ncbi:hypothetical protein evm_002639 [Chilo suppressalis]|nr:hypothetical protein evm_002639 [Chilo suppressalis]
MKSIFVFNLIAALIITTYCIFEDDRDEQKIEQETTTSFEAVYNDDEDIIEKAIESIENTAAEVNKLAKSATYTSNEIGLLYDEIIGILEDLEEFLKEPDHANKFLKAGGIDKIIMPHIDHGNTKLRGLVLIILKSLFLTLPTTKDAIPITAIDKLLDIFETDDNLAMKAHVLDILYEWLPENPKLQVRVMKQKGLEPFYEQVSKLDTSVISTLLDLFNTILNEHLKVRNARKQNSKMDMDKLILYQRIGLIERMSTPPVCNGLLNIFEATWSYSNDDNDVIAPVFKLIKNMKPFCVKVLQGKNKAINLFESLLKYVKDGGKEEYFDNLQVNTTDVKALLEDFVTELKQPLVKDEF